MAGHNISRTRMVHLDGSTLEGGGQLLRLALSLSSLTCIPIHLTDIRGKRGPISSPGKDGGLKPGHLAGVKWLAQATAAETKGMEPRSKELWFSPSRSKVATAHEEGSKDPPQTKVEGESKSVWDDIREEGEINRRTSRIPVSTPGSILLVLQAILPYLLFGSASSVANRKSPVPLSVRIDGGTNVSNSPSIDYVTQVLLPILTHKLGVPPITTILHKRGWSTGRSEIGSVTFNVIPFDWGTVLPAFNFQERGELKKVHVSILAPSSEARKHIRDNAISQLLKYNAELEILFPVADNSGSEKRFYILLVAETSNGYRLGRDWLYDLKTKGVKIEDTCAKLVSKVMNELKRELDHGGCVDEYMQDQLVVFQALAAGKATIDVGQQNASLHTRTARWVAEELLGVVFQKNGSCKGIEFSVGENSFREDENLEGTRTRLADTSI